MVTGALTGSSSRVIAPTGVTMRTRGGGSTAYDSPPTQKTVETSAVMMIPGFMVLPRGLGMAPPRRLYHHSSDLIDRSLHSGE